MQWKREVTVLVKELKSIVPLCMVHLLKSNTVLSEFPRAYSPDYVIFLRNTGCPVQYLGISFRLRARFNLLPKNVPWNDVREKLQVEA